MYLRFRCDTFEADVGDLAVLSGDLLESPQAAQNGKGGPCGAFTMTEKDTTLPEFLFRHENGFDIQGIRILQGTNRSVFLRLGGSLRRKLPSLQVVIPALQGSRG